MRPPPLRHSAAVRVRAVELAAERWDRLLQSCPSVRANLEQAGVELHLIAESESVTDLPQYRHMKGVPFEGDLTMDERGRGYGGLHPCVGEESLLCLPSARHHDHRDICSHELAHAVLDFGLDTPLRDAVHTRFRAARPLWASAYAGTNADEFFAELTMWYVGSRGDYGGLPRPAPGPEWLALHDPISYALIDAIYRGRLTPEPVHWAILEPSTNRESREGSVPTQLVIHNHLDHDLELLWLGYDGSQHPYSVVPAGGLQCQSTWATHSWLLRGERDHGPFEALPRPGRIVLS